MRARSLLIAFAVAAGFIACGGDDHPSTPAAPSLFLGSPKTLQITGNLSLTSIGQTSQLTATATFVDGGPRNVTNQVKWEVSNASVATITGSGLLRAVGVGDAQVTASYRGVTSSAGAVSVKVPATVTGLVISGPTQIVPGNTEQFTARQQLSDGSTRDVSDTASWSSTNSSVLRHLGSGRFEARSAGEARASASFQTRFAQSAAVLILPTGTFKLSGTVRDIGGTLDSATVEVISGTGAPQSTRSSFNGTYALYGVAGQIRLRVSASGYQPQEDVIVVSDHAARDFSLTTTNPIVDVTGNWTLTLSATSSCTSGWPETVRRREVTAVIAQNDTRLTVTFSGPTVRPGVRSTGRIAGNLFSLNVYGDSYYYLEYSLLDRPTPTDWVGIYGTIEGTASPSTVTGSFTGGFDYYVTSANATFLSGFPRSCQADPTLELRR